MMLAHSDESASVEGTETAQSPTQLQNVVLSRKSVSWEDTFAACTLLQLHKDDARLAIDSKQALGDKYIEESDEPGKNETAETNSYDLIIRRLQQMIQEGESAGAGVLARLQKGKLNERELQQLPKFVGLGDADLVVTADISTASSRKLSGSSGETKSSKAPKSSQKTKPNKRAISKGKAISGDGPISENYPPRQVRPLEHIRPVREEVIASHLRHTLSDRSQSRSDSRAVPMAGYPRQSNARSEGNAQSALAEPTAGSGYDNLYGPRQLQSTRSGPNAHLWAHHVVGEGRVLSSLPISLLTDPSGRDDGAVTPAAYTADAVAEQPSMRREPQLALRNRELLDGFTDTEDEK